MYFKIDDLKKATIKKDIKAVLELNPQNHPTSVRFEVREKVITSDGEKEYEIFREVASEHYSMYAIMTNTEKIVKEINEIDLKAKEELNAVINALELLGLEGIEVEEDP
ncbi:MAG: hypothetical protein QXZ22_08610 [Sulfolobales archaeon]